MQGQDIRRVLRRMTTIKIETSQPAADSAVSRIVRASAVLGMAKQKLTDLGWYNLAKECDNAINGLQDLRITEDVNTRRTGS